MSLRLCASALIFGLVAQCAAAKTVRVSEFGFDAEDSTRFLQAALDAGAEKVVVDKAAGPWVTKPLFGRSNTELVLEKGAEIVAKRGEFRNVHDSLLSFVCCTNVTISGYGAVLRMRKWDYHAAPYRKSEWRHGIDFRSCRNVRVEGVRVVESGGDGIYLGVDNADSERCNKDVVIRDVTCDSNNRQGISVISAENLLVENCDLVNTVGASPEAGIDFEPNNADQRMVNCRMVNCRSFNNAGSGFEFWFNKFNDGTLPVSVTVEKCSSEGNNEEIRFRDSSKTGYRPPPRGEVVFRDCTFLNPRTDFIHSQRETNRGITLRMKGCEFLDEPYPPRLKSPAAATATDAAPGEMRAVTPITVDGHAAYAFFAPKAGKITIRVSLTALTAEPPDDGKKRRRRKTIPPVTAFEVRDAAGAKVAEMPLWAEGEGTLVCEVPAGGVYSFGGFVNRRMTVLAADVPVALDCTVRGHSLYRAKGDLAVVVPDDVERFVVSANGISRDIRMNVSILDPDGEVANARTWIECLETFTFRKPKPGVWTVRLDDPRPGNPDITRLDVYGSLGYLFLDVGRIWR